MLCCVVAAAFILRYVARIEKLARYFGFAREPKSEPYGWKEYCELDVPAD
ncbi:MAG: hypothetical protein LBC28_01635 [Oscillospiraceae bacterium]|jgi:hypothetical protein|nr:hypothetical protein [Oscillospiraceae bacterium]